MNTQHHPGPWNVTGRNGFIYIEKVKTQEEHEANTRLIAAAPELLQMVYDLKKCIERLTADDVSQFDRDTEAYWIGEAHELLLKANPNYYKNANS